MDACALLPAQRLISEELPNTVLLGTMDISITNKETVRGQPYPGWADVLFA
jgi:hypothetical protein